MKRMRDEARAHEVDAVSREQAAVFLEKLIAVAAERRDALVRALEERGTPCAAVIGQLEAGAPRIRVI